MKKEKSTHLELIWGDTVIDLGFTSIPNLLLRNVSKLKLTDAEIHFIIQLISFKYQPQSQIRPSYRTVAERMGKHYKNVKKLAASLEDKKWLTRIMRHSPEGDYETTVFDLSRLFKKLLDLAKKEEEGGGSEIAPTPGSGIAPTGGSEIAPIRRLNKKKTNIYNHHHQDIGTYVEQGKRQDDDESDTISLPSNSYFQPQWLTGFLLKFPKQERTKVKRLAERFDHLMLTGGEKKRWVRNPTGFFVDLTGGKVNIKLPQDAPTFDERLREESRIERERAEAEEENGRQRETEKQISDAIAGLEGEELDRFIKAARKRYDFKYWTDRAVIEGAAHRIFLEAGAGDWREIFRRNI